MNRNECRIGLSVQATIEGVLFTGTVEKCNAVNAKVRSNVQYKRHSPGTVFKVPYEWLAVTGDNAVVQVKKLEYSPFDSNNLLLQALVEVYDGLSPENLTHDGELPMNRVRLIRAELERKIKGITLALNYSPTESELYDWYDQRRQYLKSREIDRVDTGPFAPGTK